MCLQTLLTCVIVHDLAIPHIIHVFSEVQLTFKGNLFISARTYISKGDQSTGPVRASSAQGHYLQVLLIDANSGVYGLHCVRELASKLYTESCRFFENFRATDHSRDASDLYCSSEKLYQPYQGPSFLSHTINVELKQSYTVVHMELASGNYEILLHRTYYPSRYRSANLDNRVCSYDPPQNAVVILRVAHSLSDVKKAVVTNYSQSLANEFDLWLLVDHTNLDSESMGKLEHNLLDVQSRAKYPIHVFLYDVDLEKRMFPTAALRFDKIGANINYYTHAISVVLWWRLCGWHDSLHDTSVTTVMEDVNHAHNTKIPSVWVIEMDAGFSGNPRLFFEFYQNKNFDLIVNDIWQADETWLDFHKRRARDVWWELSDEFYQVKSDFVVGMSARLLYHLDVLIRASVIAYGEAFESTVCTRILHDWCTIRSFSDDGFAGDVLKFDGMIDYDQWKIYNDHPEYLNKWYHAVKAQKEHWLM